MADSRFEPNSSGIRQVATSPAMRSGIRQAAERIAGRARSATDDEIVVREGSRGNRAHAWVARLGSGAAGEAKDRALGRSVGGA